MTQLIRGQYEPLEVIGRGGQGEVIRALDRQHDRQVAIKMRPLSSDQERQEILSEARVLLNLKPHANLPLVREDFFEDDHYYLVMDWVEGKSLQRLLDERGDPGLPFSRVSRFLEEVAQALDHLHGHEPPIVHRDVKPANIIATEGDQAVLVDFGISARGEPGERAEGTKGYIAPEVVTGDAPGPAADIYGLAATAYALLVGSPPTGESPHWEGLPKTAVASVERAIRKALSTDPSRRPQSARQLVEQMRAWLDERLPTGTVTFLLTDIEGSTRMWDESPEEMRKALSRHDQLIADAIEAQDGKLVESGREGDSLLAVFERAGDALAGALDLQRALSQEAWPPEASIRVRMAIHTGEGELRGGHYRSLALYRAARLMETAHGGQTLVSRISAELAGANLPQGASLRDLGSHRLRDLAESEQVFQLDHPDLPEEFPPLRSLQTLPNNLPIHLTTFIGRESELAQVEKLLSANRLVTLTGAGGVGKTRLALQEAARLMDEYADGVWLVDLAPLSDPSLVAQAVAATLGVREVTSPLAPAMVTAAEGLVPQRVPLLDRLIDYLNTRKILLVLDNLEHLISACADLADRLVRACPDLTILITSREPLGIGGEAAWRLPSLSFPDAEEVLAPEDLTAYEAVRLFGDRATLRQPRFQINESNSAAVSEICRRLDGIPLAIELAAARAQVLTAEQIAERLDDRFRLLTGGSRTALERQQTLRATVDWSHDLLSEPEQVLLRRLSVFVGGFTLEAAEEVCSGVGLDAGEILDLLSQLVAKSLVEVEPLVRKSLVLSKRRPHAARYRLLETIRQYARDRLRKSGEEAPVRTRHRDWCLALAESAEPELKQGGRQAEWLVRLEEEHDNLRAAFEWSASDEDPQPVARLASALRAFWFIRGYAGEGRRWLSQALEKSEVLTPALRAKALIAAGVLAWAHSDHKAARSLLDEALLICRDIGDEFRLAFTLKCLGLVASSLGDSNDARTFWEESLETSQRIGDRREAAAVLGNLAGLASSEGDLDGARKSYEDALAINREVGDRYVETVTLLNLGGLSMQQAEYAPARVHFEEALPIARELGARPVMMLGLMQMGMLALIQGDYEAARNWGEEAAQIARDMGEVSEETLIRGLLAYLAGNYEAGKQLLETAAAMGGQSHEKGWVTARLLWAAFCAEAEGNLVGARTHLEESLSISRGLASGGVVPALNGLGRLARAEEDFRQAEALHREALPLSQMHGDREGLAYCLEGLGAAAAGLVEFERAARLYGAAEQLREVIGAVIYPHLRGAHEASVDSVRAAMSAEAFQEACEAGRAMSLEEAVELALKADPGQDSSNR